MDQQRSSSILRIAAPLKSLVQRFTYLGLIIFAFGMMLMGKIDAVVVDRVRAEVTNAVAPILGALSRPAQTIAEGIENVRGLTDIRTENLRLREENLRLLQWQSVARKLHAENAAMRSLLSASIEQGAKFVTARVIAGSGGAFANTLVLDSGRADGVAKGQAVLTEQGFVGHIAEVSSRSSRVILLTDFNSRVPVLVESSRGRALLVGGNTRRPRLIHIAPGTRVTPSDRIVTSGHGGAFPAGLPVGIVAAVSDGGVTVQLFADYGRLEYVKVADFGLGGLLTKKP
ncbi:MAG: rod shape-determining protein MreC [Rhodospirillales bacterium]|jgi:rod shape-determining protein MreC|nr:rod shape-determining protein MreC [Rhodospirillaceae bacterium]MDP6427642.1 rod shape-determining protein MreC [Rhodospirillales bacterium]MDP6643829.1 rod shape-determining protein MreC [Rhodospirillales bacterium]MDP6842019.1 rod shape-determining protein MreC [Rhodospirillales bacterium]